MTFQALILECASMKKESKKKNKTIKPQKLVNIPEDKNLPVVSHTGLQRYLHEISQFPLLSREETEELAIRYHETDDPEARGEGCNGFSEILDAELS